MSCIDEKTQQRKNINSSSTVPGLAIGIWILHWCLPKLCEGMESNLARLWRFLCQTRERLQDETDNRETNDNKLIRYDFPQRKIR